ncbi:hypothetical protein NDU88_004968 [Pleurodeles waltl]|uniref:Uncharacterized protein n=2 Tax=Pleurodeles waltl TaxID=8319 RepID=A0AAV7VHQ4_PLEWA|nr:hypothetical protein NDU88_004968 [Pleurodeles waltl]
MRTWENQERHGNTSTGRHYVENALQDPRTINQSLTGVEPLGKAAPIQGLADGRASTMGDPNSRKKQALNRLRAQLRKKKESLADQFDFKMFVAVVFKDKKKRSALFEVSEVIPVMTNNYEENILKGVRDSSYSLESSFELLQKDIVQLHAPRYQSMRRDVIGCTQEMDFMLWPRNDIEKIVCLLFSRWKGSDDEPFRPVQARFEFHHGDYEKQFMHILSRKDKTGIVINNPNQSVFLFIDRQLLQTPRNKATIFKLCSICLYLPQEQLTHWAVGTIEDHLRPYMPE